MASRQPERLIPHVMDVFRHPAFAGGSNSNNVTRDYDNGRRAGLFGDGPTDKQDVDYGDSSSRFGEYDGSRLLRPKRRTGTTTQDNNTSVEPRHDRGYPNYSHQARTLTEKDLKHIERHLSMKKTIRKQLSRHLSQAFVESNGEVPTENGAAQDGRPTTATNNRSNPPVATQQRLGTSKEPVSSGGRHNSNYHFTVRQSKAAKTTESNFLAMLKEGGGSEGVVEKEEDDDSGHCSPTAELDLVLSQWVSGGGGGGGSREVDHRRGSKDPWSSKDNVDRSAAAPSGGELPKKSSFWKKLTIRAKSKR